MAELDLKALWKKGEGTLGDSEGFDLAKSIGKKSNDLLQKIKFILRIEFWLNIIITPAGSIIYYREFGTEWGIFIGVFFFIYFFYYLFLIRAINKFDYAGDVKHSLQKVYNYLRFYTLHYKVVIWLCFLVLPYIFLAYGFYLGYSGAEKPSWMGNETPEFEFTKQQAYIALGVMCAIPLLIASLFHYLVSLIYGRKIKKLKHILKNLD